MKSSVETKRHRANSARESFSITAANGMDRDEIYRIRHAVYARELRQHPENNDASLKDSLDGSNIYLVAKVGRKMVGFISLTPPTLGKYSIDKYFNRRELPFSVDEGLFEIRLLTVLQARRGSEAAIALMYAAFRWAEAHGGTRIVAIGRREILDLYLKAGLRAVGKSIRSGAVDYELMHAAIPEIRAALAEVPKTLARVRAKIIWGLNFSFYKPADCFHGGAFFTAVGEGFETIDRRAGIINADVLDAWFPPSPLVTAALQEHLEWLLRTSPPTRCDGFIETVAAARGLKAVNVLPGAGSSDLIFRAFPHWLTPASRALILDPTYGEYAHVLEQVIGCAVDRLPLRRDQNYDLDLDRLEEAMRANYDLVALVNPNSPTGRHLPRAALESSLRRAPAGTRIWVDETYIDYAGQHESLEPYAAESENVIVCKSMSKVYALSGARVGYLIAGAHQLEGLRAVTPPWVIGLPSQLAAVRALQDPAYYRQRHRETHELRESLGLKLEALGWCLIPGCANFLLAHLPDQGPTARQLVEACQGKGLFLTRVSQSRRKL